METEGKAESEIPLLYLIPLHEKVLQWKLLKTIICCCRSNIPVVGNTQFLNL